MNWNNKVVWITGASSGIGAELASQLSIKGASLILSSRNKEKLQAVRDACEHPESVRVVPLDLENLENLDEVYSRAQEAFGHIDVLVLNGGISQRSLILETEFDVDKKVMQIDYLANVAIAKKILPDFIKQRHGKFVVTSSVMGKYGSPYRSAYCGAKHALHGFFDVLRMEHAKDGIQVNIICPGFVNTAIAQNAITGDGSSLGREFRAASTGLTTPEFTKKMLRAIERNKDESYIGKFEVLGVYIKRFIPSILQPMVLRHKVR